MEEEIRKADSFSIRWKWYSIIDKLSMNDITKQEEVYKQNYINALNYLSYHKELDDYKIKQQNKHIK